MAAPAFVLRRGTINSKCIAANLSNLRDPIGLCAILEILMEMPDATKPLKWISHNNDFAHPGPERVPVETFEEAIQRLGGRPLRAGRAQYAPGVDLALSLLERNICALDKHGMEEDIEGSHFIKQHLRLRTRDLLNFLFEDEGAKFKTCCSIIGRPALVGLIIGQGIYTNYQRIVDFLAKRQANQADEQRRLKAVKATLVQLNQHMDTAKAKGLKPKSPEVKEIQKEINKELHNKEVLTNLLKPAAVDVFISNEVVLGTSFIMTAAGYVVKVPCNTVRVVIAYGLSYGIMTAILVTAYPFHHLTEFISNLKTEAKILEWIEKGEQVKPSPAPTPDQKYIPGLTAPPVEKKETAAEKAEREKLAKYRSLCTVVKVPIPGKSWPFNKHPYWDTLCSGFQTTTRGPGSVAWYWRELSGLAEQLRNVGPRALTQEQNLKLENARRSVLEQLNLIPPITCQNFIDRCIANNTA